MCEDEMPFRRRDGEHYFESVQLFDDLSGEHTAAHLALVPSMCRQVQGVRETGF